MFALQAYLAGPDVFKPNSEEIAKNKKSILLGKNITGIYPSDNKIENFSFSPETAAKIFWCNIDLMNGCDVILANMTPWRGPSMDPGTITELVYGANTKLVIGYYEGETKPYSQRVIEHYNNDVTGGGDGPIIASDGTSIENFGQEDNLMIPGFIKMSGGEIYPTFQEAVDNVQRLWDKKRNNNSF
jgi:nucleoside 2-deoxyribosyltransferase